MAEVFAGWGRALFKRQYKGLYGNKMIRFGFKETDSGKKIRRTWKPNIVTKGLYSELLDEKVPRVRVATSVLRTIKHRHGGSFDKYLLCTPNRILKWQRAIDMKRRLLDIMWKKARAGQIAAEERKRTEKIRQEASGSSAAPSVGLGTVIEPKT
ncbi:54S ribosomal protein L24, mitochondrial [Porphyridium purpureum]|uniref:54S ribosomal protein L24, mitochondrial n=1 Tax=Porphyridium purpureum TaxID=35688 RepID=A0A5J4YZP5_PORPP|nr:54S ribosomal protein L24, mitochondrial [Porphyridium purpureum]|eukprot:POR7580..scf208_2